MNSPTIVLAGNDLHDWDVVLLAVKGAIGDSNVVVLHDGEAVVDCFLHKIRNRSHGRLSQIAEPQECDLLLLDLLLPKLDGFQVLRQLRWLQRDDLSTLPPIVVLSDSCDADLVAAAYRYGASGFLCLSASTDRIQDAIHQTVRYWLGATLRPGRQHSQRQVAPGSLSSELATT